MSRKPNGTEAISGIQSLSREVLNAAGQVVYADRYHDLTGVTYSQTSVTLGTSGTTYDRTQFDYDKLGMLNRTVTPTGTIYRTERDGQGRDLSSWVGTDDVPSTGFWSTSNLTGTNMVQLGVIEYDNNGVGDGNVTTSSQFLGSPFANREMDLAYDWRNRLIASKQGVEGSESTSVNRPISYTEFDNLGQAIVSEMYDGDTLSITADSNSDGVPDRPASSALRAKSTADFDELGRVYQSNTFAVDPSTGSVSTNSLISKQWFNSRGTVMKSSSPGGLVAKSEFNGVGWNTKSYLTDGGGDSGYSDADDVTGDAVLSQSELTFDSNGNVIFTVNRERFHDETGTGTLGTPTTGTKARVSYAAAYFDKANRTTDTVNVGTNGGSAYTRPGSVPSRSDTVLVTSYGFNSAGWVSDVTDPKGLLGKTYYDLAGRTTKTIENYVDGTVSDTDDKTVEYSYHANDQMKTLKAYLTSLTSETTEWILGITSPVVSNDILKEMRYPDATTGASSSSEKDAYTYSQLGQAVTFTDRNGNVHTYSYDILGRITSDAITTLGSGVDGAVRRIETAYDTQGNAYLFTSYDAASGGSIVNQVQRAFNGLGQLITEWQATNGAVNTSTSPKVQYAYSFTTGGSMNHSRLTSITYPNGRVITYNYSAGLNDNISRLTSITDGSTTLDSYIYLGYATIVTRAHPETGVDLTYVKLTGESDGAAGDQYNGLDAFYRIVDQRWTTSTPTAKDRWQYGYDRGSNPLYKESLIDSTRSELFDYDGLNQLTNFSRGTLNGTKDAISGLASRSQGWDYDGLGNMDVQTTDLIPQIRAHNKQNEITASVGATTPTYDANGNQTKDFSGLGYEYDAWNRLVEVTPSGGGSAIRNYEYDALGRRIQTTTSGTTTDFFYSTAWQVLEERVSGTATRSYVWSPEYVDAMIARDRDTDANGSLDERFYVMHDANYNVTGLVNTIGTVQERYGYDSFGLPTFFDASYGVRSVSSFGFNYLHQGLSWDGGIGKYYNRRREYDPVQGRFTSNDSIGLNAGDADLYRAERNGPISGLDPLGLQDFRPQRCGPPIQYDPGNPGEAGYIDGCTSIQGMRPPVGKIVTHMFLSPFYNTGMLAVDAHMTLWCPSFPYYFNPHLEGWRLGQRSTVGAGFCISLDTVACALPFILQCKVPSGSRTTYHGTTHFNAVETCANQCKDKASMAHFQKGGSPQLGQGLYVSSSCETAWKYGEMLSHFGGGPGLIQMETSSWAWAWLGVRYGAKKGVPIDRMPGHFQDFVPMSGIDCFNKNTTFTQLPFGSCPNPPKCILNAAGEVRPFIPGWTPTYLQQRDCKNVFEN